jgi:hypothetical protein
MSPATAGRAAPTLQMAIAMKNRVDFILGNGIKVILGKAEEVLLL